MSAQIVRFFKQRFVILRHKDTVNVYFVLNIGAIACYVNAFRVMRKKLDLKRGAVLFAYARTYALCGFYTHNAEDERNVKLESTAACPPELR